MAVNTSGRAREDLSAWCLHNPAGKHAACLQDELLKSLHAESL
jgi:hypothetical protein